MAPDPVKMEREIAPGLSFRRRAGIVTDAFTDYILRAGMGTKGIAPAVRYFRMRPHRRRTIGHGDEI